MPRYDATKKSAPRKAKRSALDALLHHLSSHIAFLLALFMIQTLYTVLFLSAATDLATVRRTVTQTYDYELEYRAMTQPQYVQLYNDCGTEPKGAPESAAYTAIRYEKMSDGSYNAYITLKGITRRIAAENFLYRHGIPDLEIGYSPLYDYKTAYLPDILLFVAASSLVVFGLSVFWLVQLYRMRLDRDTFDYAICMTCGAGYRRLYRKSCSELALLSLLSFVPALILGSVLTVLLYATRGVFPITAPVVPLIVAAFSALTILTAVKLPMRQLSKKPPVELLRARDNSNHVVSPRRSRRIFGAAFPRDFELLSLWRYRRYFAALLIPTVLLPVLFMASLTMADVYQKRQSAPAPDFTLTFTPEIVNPEVLNQNTAVLADRLSGVDGVSLCLPEALTYDATAVCGHMLLSDRNVTSSSRGVRYEGGASAEGYHTATNAYSYTALDEAAIRALEAQYSHIDGDPFSVLSDEHTILISESINATASFRFSVGDKLLVAVEAVGAEVEGLVIDDEQTLLLQLESGTFVYQEFVVGAVIHDPTPHAKLTFGICFDTYTDLTGETPTRYSTDVYLQSDADFATWEQVSNAVYAAGFDYYHCHVTDHNVFFDRYLASLSNMEGRLRLLAVGFLIMMPLISFFSQFVFYKKREREWQMLKALGATSRQLLRSSLLAGCAQAAVFLAVSLPAMLIGHQLVFTLFNRYLPALGFMDAVVLKAAFPWSALLTAGAVTLLCALIPPVACGLSFYWRNRSRSTSLMAGQ